MNFNGRAALAAACVAGIAALAATLSPQQPTPPPSIEASTSTPQPAGRGANEATHSAPQLSPHPHAEHDAGMRSPDTPGSAPISRWPFNAQFHASDDLFALATDLRELAGDGNPGAMWTLGRIYDNCELLAVKYGAADGAGQARRRIQTVTASMPPAAAHYHQRQFDRCRGFVESPEQLENAEIWQTLAAEAGHPAAQLKSWLDQRMDAGIGKPDRDRIVRLIESGHPDALQLAPRLLHLRSAEPDAVGDTLSKLAWTLAACRLGMDCSPQGETTRIRCIWSNCGAQDSLIDLIESETDPYLYQRANDLAQQLQAHIAAGTLRTADWVELDQKLSSGR